MADIALRDTSSEFEQNDIDALVMAVGIDPLPFDVSFVTTEHLFSSDENYDFVFAFSSSAKTLFLTFICLTPEAKQRVLVALDQMKAVEA